MILNSFLKSSLKYSTSPVLQIFNISICGERTLKLTSVFNINIKIFRRTIKMSTASSFQRLPTTVVPLNYDLTYEPNFTNHNFTAQATIDVQVNEEITRIMLNATHFQVSKVEYKDESGKSQESEVHVLDNESELLKIDFAQPIKPGQGVLDITFRGVVNDNLKGFFRSKYRTADGQDKFNYITKFEPAFARYCFPCWDEPAIKATFDITLVVPKNLTALSNMPVKEEFTSKTDDTKKVVKFQRSVKMSTYVMAFAIGEFDYVESRSSEGILCRVYAPVGKKERGQYALKCVAKALSFYNNYFGVPYPLPKMDLLAVNEYPCGAMENWGLVIYKEVALLIDENLSSTANIHRVALTTTHETAHMWFGNLVTMKWWSDLWLNEGYATFMEFVCTDDIYPQYNIWESMVHDCTITALDLDSLKSSHPIQVVVDNPASVGEIFDAISYCKGAAVIRMLNNYIGDADFKKGMQLYLSRHQFNNAETEDLWAALSEASGKPVEKIMSTWTKQMGFPILKVKKVTQSGNSKILTVSYEKFWADPKLNGEGESSSYKWIIPITMRKKSEPVLSTLSLVESNPGTDFELMVNNTTEDDWVKLNADCVGYYRVCYPPEVLSQFITSIQNKTMGPIDRLGVLDDLFATVKAGQSSSSDMLKTLLAFSDEDNYNVWSVINEAITSFNVILSGTDLHDNFATYSRQLFEKISNKLGWDSIPGESSHNSILRTTILIRMVGLGHQPTIEEAKRRFEMHVSGEKAIHPDVIPAVYRAMIIDGGEPGLQALLTLYRKSDLLEEKFRILRALGAARNPELIQNILEFGISNEVNKQDIAILMMSFTSKPGREAAWEFFKKNVKHFQTVFPSGGWNIRGLVKITANFTTEEKAQEVGKFFKENKITGTDRAVEQSLESIHINQAWFNRDYSSIAQFLSNYN